MAQEVAGWAITNHQLPEETRSDLIEIVREVIIEVTKNWMNSWRWWRRFIVIYNLFNIRGYAVEQELENKINLIPHYRKQFAHQINREFSYLDGPQLDILVKEAHCVDKL